MALDFNSILNSMVTAAEGSLKEQWPSIKDLATTSLKSLAQNLVDIETMNVAGTITPEQAGLLVDMQKNALQAVLLSEEGLGLLAAQAAINAVIGVVSDVVNKALGFALL